MEWVVPKNVDKIKSFIRSTCYYMRFIEGFFALAYLIASLQKKGIKFEWSQKCQDNFDKLKQLLTITLILKFPDPNKDVLVCINACRASLGDF